jgi:hypothetical protein
MDAGTLVARAAARLAADDERIEDEAIAGLIRGG